jgi:hypothetical protein
MPVSNVRNRAVQGKFEELTSSDRQQEATARLKMKHPSRPCIPDMPAARRKGRENMLPIKVRTTLPKNVRFPAGSHVVHEGDMAKIIGYNVEEYPVKGSDETLGYAATTGTSRPNVLCITDGMGPCIGVAIIGEKDGQAKARLFHVFSYNTTAPASIKAHINDLKKNGMAVRVGISGGIKGDEDSEGMHGRIKTSISETDRDHAGNPVVVEFDTGCSMETPSGLPLGVIIDDNHKGKFVQEVVMAPAPDGAPQPRGEWTYPISSPSVQPEAQ